MTKYENECCGCATPGYPCRGSECRMRHVPHYYCDKCHEEADQLYILDDEELCEYCVIESLEKVVEE